MPIIQINLIEGRSVEAKRKFAAEMTKVTCECFDVVPEQVRIIINDMKPENYAIAGTLIVDRKNSRHALRDIITEKPPVFKQEVGNRD
jgi:4-oxalocrotonate tautomerase